MVIQTHNFSHWTIFTVKTNSLVPVRNSYNKYLMLYKLIPLCYMQYVTGLQLSTLLLPALVLLCVIVKQ